MSKLADVYMNFPNLVKIFQNLECIKASQVAGIN